MHDFGAHKGDKEGLIPDKILSVVVGLGAKGGGQGTQL